MGIKHIFQSAKGDGADATIVRPSNWNDNHTIDSEVQIPVVASPPVPAAGNFNLWGNNLGGRILPAFRSPVGGLYTIQPQLGKVRASRYQAFGNAATFAADSMAAPTAVGTTTVRNVATTNALTRMKRNGWVSVATAGGLSSLYWVAASAQYTIGNGAGLGGFLAIFRFGVSDAATVSGARMFVGMSTNVAAPTNVEPNTLTNTFGLAQLSTDATQWYMVQGGSAAQAAIALGTGLGAPTVVTVPMELALYASPSNGNVGYTVTNLGTGVSVTGTLTAAVAGTQLPLNTALLAPRLYRTNNATALSIGLDLGSIYIETDT